MYLAWHDVHDPLQAPASFHRPPHYNDSNRARLTLNAMVRVHDEAMRNVTDVLHSTGLWPATLLVWSADNGGWLRDMGGTSNYPLRGGKKGSFEGGIRVPAALGGGWLPSPLRGSASGAVVHLADWCVGCSVFCPVCR